MKSLVRGKTNLLREFARNSEMRQENFARQVDFEAFYVKQIRIYIEICIKQIIQKSV